MQPLQRFQVYGCSHYSATNWASGLITCRSLKWRGQGSNLGLPLSGGVLYQLSYLVLMGADSNLKTPPEAAFQRAPSHSVSSNASHALTGLITCRSLKLRGQGSNLGLPLSGGVLYQLSYLVLMGADSNLNKVNGKLSGYQKGAYHPPPIALKGAP